MWSWRQWRRSCQSQVTLLVRTGKSIVCTTRGSAVVKTNANPKTAFFFVGNNFYYNDSKNFLRKVEDLTKWLSGCKTSVSVNTTKIKAQHFSWNRAAYTHLPAPKRITKRPTVIQFLTGLQTGPILQKNFVRILALPHKRCICSMWLHSCNRSRPYSTSNHDNNFF